MMVTGDNAQCAHYIARECGMVVPNAQIILGDEKDGNRLDAFSNLCTTVSD